jgi:hypothetical protein
VRVCVPAPHVAEHADQADQPPLTIVVQVAAAVQVCEVTPTQALPPLLGRGFVHVRV